MHDLQLCVHNSGPPLLKLVEDADGHPPRFESAPRAKVIASLFFQIVTIFSRAHGAHLGPLLAVMDATTDGDVHAFNSFSIE